MNKEFEMNKKEDYEAKTREELKKYWNYKRNAPLLPKDVDLNSSEVVWMQCPDGHNFTLSIRNFAMGARCPYDSGKLWPGRTELSVKFPELAKEFDAEKNGFSSDEIESNSEMSVWWKCPNGHTYKISVKAKTKGKGCPYCGKID